MEKITVTLDRPREIKWTHRARMRLGELNRPVEFRDVADENQNRAFYALVAHIWAALEDRDVFAKPEDLADYLGGEDAQQKAFEILYTALVAAGVIAPKKKATPSESPQGSMSGHSLSSNSAPGAPTTSS